MINFRHSNDYEKGEASKKIVYLYDTFKKDFQPPLALNIFIRPHLDLLEDSNPMVRAQICYNLAAFDIRRDLIVTALIKALNDEAPIVVDAAMASLARFGIDSTDTLMNEMIKLKFLPKFYNMVSQTNRLDILLARLEAKNVPICGYENIHLW